MFLVALLFNNKCDFAFHLHQCKLRTPLHICMYVCMYAVSDLKVFGYLCCTHLSLRAFKYILKWPKEARDPFQTLNIAELINY